MPLVSSYVLKVKVLTRIGLVAPDNDGEEETVVYHHILEGDVPESYSWLCGTGPFRIEWEQHTSWSISVRLLHLLRTNVNGPPVRSLHCDVFVPDVLNYPVPDVSWISLDINTFPGPFHIYVSESYVPDAVCILVRRHTSNGDSYSENHCDVLHQHVVSAVSVKIAPVTRFGNNDIIPILNCHVVNMEV